MKGQSDVKVLYISMRIFISSDCPNRVYLLFLLLFPHSITRLNNIKKLIKKSSIKKTLKKDKRSSTKFARNVICVSTQCRKKKLKFDKWEFRLHTLLKISIGSLCSTMSWQLTTQPYTWKTLFDARADWVRSLAWAIRMKFITFQFLAKKQKRKY